MCLVFRIEVVYFAILADVERSTSLAALGMMPPVSSSLSPLVFLSILVGCRARIRTWAKGSKVLCATTTQPGTTSCPGAEGRIRTDTGVAPQQFLRLSRLPFRHFGGLTIEVPVPFSMVFR